MKTDQHAAQLAEALRAFVRAFSDDIEADRPINGADAVETLCELMPEAVAAVRAWDAHNKPAPTQRALL